MRRISVRTWAFKASVAPVGPVTGVVVGAGPLVLGTVIHFQEQDEGRGATEEEELVGSMSTGLEDSVTSRPEMEVAGGEVALEGKGVGMGVDIGKLGGSAEEVDIGKLGGSAEEVVDGTTVDSLGLMVGSAAPEEVILGTTVDSLGIMVGSAAPEEVIVGTTVGSLGLGLVVGSHTVEQKDVRKASSTTAACEHAARESKRAATSRIFSSTE